MERRSNPESWLTGYAEAILTSELSDWIASQLPTTRGLDVDKRGCSKESRNNHIECSILKSVKGSEFSLNVSQTQRTGQKMSLPLLL